MPETDISICSKALVLLGAEPISSFNEEKDTAKTCAIIYPMVKSDLCSRYPWRFLMKKKELTRDATAPIGEWKYSYVLPGEMQGAAPTALFSSPSHQSAEVPFEIFGRRVYCDFERVFIDYTTPTIEAEWPPYFVNLMVYALCAHIGFTVTDQQNVVDTWQVAAFGSPSENGMGGMMGTATAIDSQGQSNYGIDANAFLDARAGGYGYAY